MSSSSRNFISSAVVLSLLNLASAAHAFVMPTTHLLLEAGGFLAHQGKAQNVGIDTLIGDRFTVTDYVDQNFLAGLGLYLDGICNNKYALMYGINAYYLAPTKVKGYIVQEQLFPNLTYRYNVTNIPIYLAAKALVFMNNSAYTLTVNGGLGANIISTGNYSEESADGGVTIPGNTFSSHDETAFSAMIGVGIQFNRVLGRFPVELSYQFFYLGNGHLKKGNEVLNNLDTGDSYANALMLTVSLA